MATAGILGDINIVPDDEIDQPDYIYQAEVDFSKTTKMNKSLMSCFSILLTALLNAAGGILKLTNQPGTKCDQEIMDQWRRDMTQKLDNFIPDRASLVTMEISRVDARNVQLLIFVRKSANIITLDSFMFVSDGPQRTKATTVTKFTQIFQQQTKPSRVLLHIQQGSVNYGDIMPDEAGDLEYKHWEKKLTAKKTGQPKTAIEVYKKLIMKQAANSLFSLPNQSGGGALVIGVDDDTCRVMGQELDVQDEKELTDFVKELLTEDPEYHTKRIWGDENTIPRSGINWNITFTPVDNAPAGSPRLVLITIQMSHCKGGLFQKCPLSYTLTSDGTVKQMTFLEWRTRCIKDSNTHRSTEMNKGARMKKPTSRNMYAGMRQLEIVQKPTESKFNLDFVNQELKKTTELELVHSDTEWRRAILITSLHLPTDVTTLASECHVFQPRSPLQFTPDESILLRACPGIQTVLNYIKQVCIEPGYVIGSKLLLDCFSDKLNLAEHVMELLVIQEKVIHLWVVVRNVVDQAAGRAQDAYMYLTGRTIKRHLIETMFDQKNHIMLPLICHKYSLHDGCVVTTNTIPEALTEPRLSYTCTALALSHLLLSKETHIKKKIDDYTSILLSAQQYGELLKTIRARISFIEGPPGVGKTILGLKLCEDYKREEVLYIVSTPEFSEFIKYQGKSMTARVTQDYHLQELVDDGKLNGLKCLIFDDVQTMCISIGAWIRLLEYIITHTFILVLFLADPEVQSYIPGNCATSLRQHVEHFCREKKIRFAPCNLGVVHRNTQKVTAYVQECTGISEPLECSSQTEGLGADVVFMPNALEDSSNNPLINYLKDITKPRPLLTHGATHTLFDYSDMVVLVPQPDVDRIGIIQHLLSKYLGEDSLQKQTCYPITGIRVTAIGGFHGLEAHVCIAMIKDRTLCQDQKMRAFIASRAITKLRFVVCPEQTSTALAHGLDVDLVQGLGCRDLSRFQPSARETSDQDTTEVVLSDKTAEPTSDVQGDSVDQASGSARVHNDKTQSSPDNSSTLTGGQTDAASNQDSTNHGESAKVQDDTPQNLPDDNPAVTAGALKAFLDSNAPADHQIHALVKQMEAQAEAALYKRYKPRQVVLGGHYMSVMLQVLSRNQLPVEVLGDAWLLCFYLVNEDTNTDLYVSGGGVHICFTALKSHTDPLVIYTILGVILNITSTHPTEAITPAYIDQLLVLLDHEHQIISYWSCRVLVSLIINRPPTSTWPGIDTDKVSSRMMSTMAGWRLEKDVSASETDLTVYKDNISHTHPAVSSFWAWDLANFVTRDPDTYCDMVVRDVGLEHIRVCVADDGCPSLVVGLLNTVIRACQDHTKV